MRSLGLDIGDRKTGVAISDPDGVLATPLTVIERGNQEDVITDIIKLVEQYKVECIVVGLPYSLDGHLTQQTKKVEAFTEKLQNAIASPSPLSLRAERINLTAQGKLREEAANGFPKNSQNFSGEKQSRLTGVSIQMWDERLSSVAAERLMIEAGTKKDKRKQHQDALAAAIILQGFLDSEAV
jgi:putative Holliday junction resolvase